MRSNIVESYGRRRYKQEFIRFLVFASASCDETIDHLESLFDTGSLADESAFKLMHQDLGILSTKLNVFIRGVEAQHMSVKEGRAGYELAASGEPANDESED